MSHAKWKDGGGAPDETASEWWRYQPVLSRPVASTHRLVVLADSVGDLDGPPIDDASIHTLNLITVWIRLGHTVHILSPYRPRLTAARADPSKALYPPRIRPLRHERCLYHSLDVVLRQVVPGDLSLQTVWLRDERDREVCDPGFFTTVAQHLCHRHKIGHLFVRDSSAAHPKRRFAEALLQSDLPRACDEVVVCGINPFSQSTLADPSAVVRSYGAVPACMVSAGPAAGRWLPPLVRETLETGGRAKPERRQLRVVYSGSAHSEYVWWLPRLALALVQLREASGADLELWVVIHQRTRSSAFAQMEASLSSLPFLRWHYEPSLNQRLRIYEECDLGVMLSSTSRLSAHHHAKVAERCLAPHRHLYAQKDVRRVQALAGDRMRRLCAEQALPATLVEMGSRGLPVVLDRTPGHQRVAGHDYPLYLPDANIRSFRELVGQTLGLARGAAADDKVYRSASSRLLAAVRRDYTIAAQVERERRRLVAPAPAAPPPAAPTLSFNFEERPVAATAL